MTTPTSNDRRKPFTGNGVATVFNGPMAYVGSDIQVFLQPVGGVSALVSGSLYTITNFGRVAGTRVVMTTPPAVGEFLQILRTVDYSQQTNLTNQGAYLPETVEKGLDQLAFQISQLADRDERTFRFADSVSLPNGFTMELDAATPLGIPQISADGLRMELGSGIGSGDLLLRGNLADDDPGKGSDLVSFPDTLATAYLKTLSDIANGSEVSLLRFIPSSQYAGIRDSTGTYAASANINTALASGARAIYAPYGKYNIVIPQVIRSDTRLRGDGPGTLFKVDAASFPVTGGSYGIIRNLNNAVAVLTDHDIDIEGIAFDYDTYTVPGGGAHALQMRYVDRVRILNCTFRNGENGTALLACRDTVTAFCHARGIINCGFDHWDGAGTAIVEGCIVRNINDGGQGIQFTGTASDLSPRSSLDVSIINNQIYGIDLVNSAGIIVNGNAIGSSVYRARIIGNNVSDCSIGIGLTGGGGQHIVSGNTVHACDEVGMILKEDIPGDGGPSNCLVTDNLFVDCPIDPANIGLIAITAGSGHVFSGNKSVGGSYPYAYRVASGVNDCTIVDNHIPIGSSGWVLDAGTGTKFHSNAATSVYHEFFTRARFATGLLFGTDTAAGNVLDDYEEGSWTPVVRFGGVTTGITYTVQQGRYTKVGDLVTVSAYINLSSKGAAAGLLTVAGLPFLPETSSGMFYSLSVPKCLNLTGVTALNTYINGANIAFQLAGTATDLADTHATNTTQIWLQGAFKVAP